MYHVVCLLLSVQVFTWGYGNINVDVSLAVVKRIPLFFCCCLFRFSRGGTETRARSATAPRRTSRRPGSCQPSGGRQRQRQQLWQTRRRLRRGRRCRAAVKRWDDRVGRGMVWCRVVSSGTVRGGPTSQLFVLPSNFFFCYRLPSPPTTSPTPSALLPIVSYSVLSLVRGPLPVRLSPHPYCRPSVHSSVVRPCFRFPARLPPPSLFVPPLSAHSSLVRPSVRTSFAPSLCPSFVHSRLSVPSVRPVCPSRVSVPCVDSYVSSR